jgi:Acetyltransferase (GNAT) domain
LVARPKRQLSIFRPQRGRLRGPVEVLERLARGEPQAVVTSAISGALFAPEGGAVFSARRDQCRDFSKWSKPDSNRRPPGCDPGALNVDAPTKPGQPGICAGAAASWSSRMSLDYQRLSAIQALLAIRARTSPIRVIELPSWQRRSCDPPGEATWPTSPGLTSGFSNPRARGQPRWDPEHAATALQRAISSDTATVLIAAVDDGLIGCCTVYDHIDSVRFGRGVWVEDLAVHPGHRSQGVGRQLLDEAKCRAQARGSTQLQLVS